MLSRPDIYENASAWWWQPFPRSLGKTRAEERSLPSLCESSRLSALYGIIPSRNCWCEFLVARHRTCVSKRLGVQDEATLAACVKNRKKYLHQLLIETATMVARFKTACGGIWKCFFSSVFPFLSALFLSGLPAPLFFL